MMHPDSSAEKAVLLHAAGGENGRTSAQTTTDTSPMTDTKPTDMITMSTMLVIDMRPGSAILRTHLHTTGHPPHIRTGLHLDMLLLSGTHQDLLLHQPTLGLGHQGTVILSTEAEVPGRHEDGDKMYNMVPENKSSQS